MPGGGDLLIIFVKHPVAGEVKTRLARDIGAERAVALYRELLNHTAQVVAATTADKVVFYGNAMPAEDLWQAAGYPRLQQEGEELGARMAHAFEWAFAAGYRRVLLIGSDCPALAPAHLERAFALLQTHALVFGPATDGGYYLTGMKRLHGQLFSPRAWSHAKVLEEALRDAVASGLSVALLPELRDVDQIEDLG